MGLIRDPLDHVTEPSGGRVHKTGLGQGSRGSSSFKDNVLITKGLEQNEQAWSKSIK